MNEWALVRMRRIQVYQQSHHAAGHMTGLERCSALIPWLIQIKYLGNTDFLLALVSFILGFKKKKNYCDIYFGV